MDHPPKRRESADKAAGGGEKPLSKAKAEEAMAKFRTLTKRLLDVPPEDAKAAQKKYAEDKAARRSRGR